MKYRWDKKYLYWGVTVFCVIAVSILFFLCVFFFQEFRSILSFLVNIIKPVLYGLIMGYILEPIVFFIEKSVLHTFIHCKCKMKSTDKSKKRLRALSIFLTFLGVVGSGILLFSCLIPQLFFSLSNLVLSYQFKYNEFIQSIESLFLSRFKLSPETARSVEYVMNDISHYLNEWLISMMQQLVRLYTTEMSGILSILDDIILGGIISVYLLNSKELLIAQFKKCIYGLFSLSHANIIISDLRLANKMFSGFLSGTILDSVIVGSVCFIGTWLLNIPYSVLVSIIIGITNIIPFFGPYIGAIPCILLILFVSPEKSLHFLIFIIILQNIDGNFVAPKILGIRTGISSFWVLISVILSGGLFGFWGLLFGVPVFAFFYALIKAKINRALSRKNLPIDTAAYLVLQEKEIEKRN